MKEKRSARCRLDRERCRALIGKEIFDCITENRFNVIKFITSGKKLFETVCKERDTN